MIEVIAVIFIIIIVMMAFAKGFMLLFDMFQGKK